MIEKHILMFLSGWGFGYIILRADTMSALFGLIIFCVGFFPFLYDRITLKEDDD